MSEPAPVDFAVIVNEARRQAEASSLQREEVGRDEGMQEGCHEEVSYLRTVSSAGNEKTKTPRPPDFNALVRPIENLHPAWRLREPGLGWCLVYHHDDPEGFRQCVTYVIESWDDGSSEKPLGLLCQLAREWVEGDDE